VRVKLQPAFVLHSRPYRDSSQILDVLTAEYGRLALVAKGSKRSRRGGSAGAILQPFIPLLVSFSGRSEMKTLVASEMASNPVTLGGERLFSAMYLNELMVRLLHHHDPHPALFLAYANTLRGLNDEACQLHTELRRFEFTLLCELGFGFELAWEGGSGEAVTEDGWYGFDPDHGLVHLASPANGQRAAFPGCDLKLMAAGEFGEPVKGTAKRLLRLALAQHLGEKPIKSRDLFRRR
jgi:DNA repair protein RecO (recombination protein O)